MSKQGHLTGSGAGFYALCVLIGLLPVRSLAQDFSADQIKAAYLYRFTSYVDWPAGSLHQTFTIATLCEDGVAAELEGVVRGKQVKGLPIQVRRLKSLDALEDAQLLYIGPACAVPTKELESLVSKPVLIVTDGSADVRTGTIHFLSEEDHVRFEVSLRAARTAHLTISAELLSVAVRVLAQEPRDFHCGIPPGAPPPPSCPQRVVRR